MYITSKFPFWNNFLRFLRAKKQVHSDNMFKKISFPNDFRNFKNEYNAIPPLRHRRPRRFTTNATILIEGSPWHVNIMSNANSNLSVLGESTRLVPANTPAIFEIITSSAAGGASSDLSVHVIAPSKRSVQARVLPGNRSGVQSVEFVPTEVGTHVVEVSIDGEKLPSGPLVAKVYDAGLIQVADVSGGVVGQPVQFRGKCKSFFLFRKRFWNDSM